MHALLGRNMLPQAVAVAAYRPFFAVNAAARGARMKGNAPGGRNLSCGGAQTKVRQGQMRVTAATATGAVACPQPAVAPTDAVHVKLFIFAAQRPFAPLLLSSDRRAHRWTRVRVAKRRHMFAFSRHVRPLYTSEGGHIFKTNAENQCSTANKFCT